MPNEMSWTADDKKLGMSMAELERAVDIVRQTRPGKRFRIKAVVGFSQQLQKITFVEAEYVDPQA